MRQPLILHIESSTDLCSIAISKGAQILALQESLKEYSHASKITLLIEACMEEAALKLSDLDAIAYSEGPGSYTALRIGLSTAKGIGYALNKPLIAVDTLESLAKAAAETDLNALICPMIDARRMEVYTKLYDENMDEIEPLHNLIVDEGAFEKHYKAGAKIVFCGNGAEKCQAVLPQATSIFKSIRCSAIHLVPLALVKYKNSDFVDLAYSKPNYYKGPNITTAKKRI